MLAPPAPLQDDHEWSFGWVENRTGWFPTEFVRQVPYSVLAAFQGSDWGSEYSNLAASDVVEVAESLAEHV